MIEWCEDLDYEKYTDNWHEIATSNKPDVPKGIIEQNPYKITAAELGGFSFESENPQVMALQREMDAQGMAMNPQGVPFTQA